MQLIRIIRTFMHDCFLFSTILSFHPSSMQDKIFNSSPSFRMFRLLHPTSPPRQRGEGGAGGVRGNHKTLIPPMSLLNLMPMGRFANRPCIGTSSSERTGSHNNRSLYEQLFEQRTSAFLRFVCLFTYKRAVFPTAQTMCLSVSPPVAAQPQGSYSRSHLSFDHTSFGSRINPSHRAHQPNRSGHAFFEQLD